jgi:hypothetical protein
MLYRRTHNERVARRIDRLSGGRGVRPIAERSDYSPKTVHIVPDTAVGYAVRLATGMTAVKLPAATCLGFRGVSLIAHDPPRR